jgi:hypothetical protein
MIINIVIDFYISFTELYGDKDEEFLLLRGLQCGVSVLQARQTDAVRYATLYDALFL